MSRHDPRSADDARAVYDWIVGESDIAEIGLSRILRFAWFDLSVKWMGTDRERRDVLDAGATLFEALGLDSYASVLRSSQTAEILAAHSRGYDEGLASFLKAFTASGMRPPDLEDFEWGELMAVEESSAHSAVEAALEQALSEGLLTPGTRGWKTEVTSITAEVLDGPHPELPGQSWRSAIMTERIYSRLRMYEGRAPGLHMRAARHANRLLHPTPPPPDLDAHMEPITWFLEQAADGLRLTQAGYLPTAMVRSGAERFGWDKGWIEDAPQKESDSSELMSLHELLLDMKAIRHRTVSVKITGKGRLMMTDPEYAWRTVTASLTSHVWATAVVETYTLLILDGETDQDVLADEALMLLIEFGWRTEGDLPDVWDARHAWRSARQPLATLGGFVESGRLVPRTAALTPFGEATLIEHLRLYMTGPIRYS